MRGLNELRPVVKLADGTMLVADFRESASTYWRENEFYFIDIPRWRVLDPNLIIGARDATGSDTPTWKTNIDLSKVDEVGFTDLTRGGGHGQAGNSGIDWFEVHGTPVRRTGSSNP
jgi:hypothetical protein